MTRFTRHLLLVAALVTLGIAIQQHYRVTLKLQDPLGGHINDFDRWMLMTPAFVHDHADYVNDRLPTPPISLLILAPFTALSRPAAQFVWVCLKLPLACVVFALALAIVRRCGARLTAVGDGARPRGLVAAGGPGHAGGADELRRAAAADGRLVPRAGRAPLDRCDRGPARRPGDRRQGDAGDLRGVLPVEAAVDGRGVRRSPAWRSGRWPCRPRSSAGIRICAG